jgi:uracil-DNA glycosylase
MPFYANLNRMETPQNPSRPIALEPSWLNHLEPEFQKPYMQNLREFLQQEKQSHQTIFPPSNQIFNAFTHTPFEKVKVVILGQDPYHNEHQAHGLCFSVQQGIRPPPSLLNIFTELERDPRIPFTRPNHGNLTNWADQGVLLLNSVLTVRAHQAASHQGKGWEIFTDAAIRTLAEKREHLVFLLWGSYAQKKGSLINRNKHLVLQAPHPSPLSAHRGFIGCNHFSQANEYLQKNGREKINW